MINIDELTKKECQEIINQICAKYSVVSKSFKDDAFHDVSYIEIVGLYDDNFHADKINKTNKRKVK